MLRVSLNRGKCEASLRSEALQRRCIADDNIISFSSDSVTKSEKRLLAVLSLLSPGELV